MSASDENPFDLESYRDYLMLLANVELARQLRTRVDPSDVVQETLLVAHERWEQWRGSTGAELAAWLRRILATRLANLLRDNRRIKRDVRRERRLDRSPEDSTGQQLQVVDSRDFSPSCLAIGEELALGLASALMDVSAAEREVFILRQWEGHQLREIASRMGTTRGEVVRQLRRVLRTLRTRLQGFE